MYKEVVRQCLLYARKVSPFGLHRAMRQRMDRFWVAVPAGKVPEGMQNSALMKQLRYRAVEQKTLSSP
ncbi:MAG: hypothetical protein K9K30_14080 [Burkholderiaceae bacterium]|nr:hypothetical protein [Sulfuritalea sp.]MCF8176364.1 hypothetical protein [Burkholderiaceae bacterium]MCF8185034.1 hypothetical protein [Polynucleobacter sp.]